MVTAPAQTIPVFSEVFTKLLYQAHSSGCACARLGSKYHNLKNINPCFQGQKNNPELCRCLRDVKRNGINDKLMWMADHYFDSK